MAEDLIIERTTDGHELSEGSISRPPYLFRFHEGLCAADPGDPSRPRKRSAYLEKVLQPLIDSREVSDGSFGPFDDRKLRFHSAGPLTISPHDLYTLEVEVGITYFQKFIEDRDRPREGYERLAERGRNDFEDRWAYFQRAFGVAAIPITSEGSVFVGARTNTEDTGELNGAAGYATYMEDPAEIRLEDDVIRELHEEFGVTSQDYRSGETHPQFVGLFSHPKGDVDFTYLVKTTLPDDYFLSGDWREKAKDEEHGPLIRLASMDDIQRLLSTGKVPDSDRPYDVVYSTRGALQNINERDLREVKV